MTRRLGEHSAGPGADQVSLTDGHCAPSAGVTSPWAAEVRPVDRERPRAVGLQPSMPTPMAVRAVRHPATAVPSPVGGVARFSTARASSAAGRTAPRQLCGGPCFTWNTAPPWILDARLAAGTCPPTPPCRRPHAGERVTRAAPPTALPLPLARPPGPPSGVTVHARERPVERLAALASRLTRHAALARSTTPRARSRAVTHIDLAPHQARDTPTSCGSGATSREALTAPPAATVRTPARVMFVAAPRHPRFLVVPALYFRSPC